ncbi:MAG: transposase, partial [Burkholderiales bacterium]
MLEPGASKRRTPGSEGPLPDYWAVDVLQACGARVHLAHPLGVKGFRYRRVKNDVRDAGDLADLLRMNRLPEAWIAPPATRELRELVRYRAKLVA